MRTLTVLFVLVFSCFHLFGQGIPDTFKIYQVWIKPLDNSATIKGVLYALNDSSIFISNSLLKKDYCSGNYWAKPILVKNVKTLKVRRKGSVGKGALTGILSGAITGIIVGFAAGDDPPGLFSYDASQKATWAGIGFAIIGVSVGAGIGSSSKNFQIEGRIENYSDIKDRLSKYTIIKE